MGDIAKLASVIGQNVRRLREAGGATQDSLAHTLRGAGLDWGRTTVSGLEAGARDVTAAELVLLAVALRCAPADLLAGSERVALSPTATAPLVAVRQFLVEGERRLRDFDTPEYRAGKANQMRLYDVWVAEVREADRKAARKLHVPVEALAEAAHDLWGQSLVEERDARLEGTEATGRSLQALRGHVTRQLVAELAPKLNQEGA